ncbi:unnamed protein product [Leptosia nina]|uniref:Uncharacterized protein n=1 Tax=Leptosia nina TaxID=320188 RepID=A0AAV1J757_9NEOP
MNKVGREFAGTVQGRAFSSRFQIATLGRGEFRASAMLVPVTFTQQIRGGALKHCNPGTITGTSPGDAGETARRRCGPRAPNEWRRALSVTPRWKVKVSGAGRGISPTFAVIHVAKVAPATPAPTPVR